MEDDSTQKLPPLSQQKSKVESEIVEKLDVDQDQPTTRLPKSAWSFTLPRPILPSRPRQVHNKKRKASIQRIALSMFGIFLLLGCGTLSLGYYYYTNVVQKPLDQFIKPVSRGKDEPALNNTDSYSGISGRSWNILLLGSDNDSKYSLPAVLTQVMMVVHIDTVNNSVTMVSLPRDSWVDIPENQGMHKIDQAFFLGATQNNSFADGVRLARLTVEKDYGLSIDRYAWVGLSGFAKVIDTLGGVDVDVTHPIVDDTYPDDTGQGTDANNPNAYRRLNLAPGPQHLNGEAALQYVRSRHADLIGDIGRTQRQQQVLEALKLKFNISSVITNLSQLIKDLNGQIYTDLSQSEMLAFANYGRTLPGKAIQRITLGTGTGDQNFGEQASIYDPSIDGNQDVILPNCAQIQPVINRIFGLDTMQSCHVDGS